MKQQLGTMLAAGMLLCASLAWSQSSGTSSSPPGSSNSSQAGSSSSSQPSSSSSSQPGSSSSSPSGSPSLAQPLFTNSSPDDSTQSGAGDSTQSGGSDSTQTGSLGPQDTFTHPEQLPALDLFGDTVSHAGLRINTSAGTLVQNISNYGGPSTWDALSLLGGGISVAEARPKFGFVASYQGGVDISNGYYTSTLEEVSQTAFANLSWNFAKRWQLRAKDSYIYSSDPFQPFFTYLGQPTANNPNPVVYFPQAIAEQNNAELDLTYELSAHDVINFNGTESLLRYIRGGIADELYNSVSYSEGAFYQHQYSARLAFGGGYQFAALDFGHGAERAGVNNFEGFASYVFNAHVQASLWIGPELTGTKDIVPVFCNQFGCFVEIMHDSSWSLAEGGTLKWRISPSNEVNLQASRGVSNAGGLLGAANIYQATATYSRPLSRAWNLGAALQYNDSTSVSNFRAEQYVKAFAGTVNVSRRLFNNSWTMNAYFALIHQNQNFFGLPDKSFTDGLGVTVQYVWSHGLGR